MNRLFFRTLFAFLTAVLIFAGVMIVILIWGLNRSIDQWSAEKRTTVEQFVGTVLEEADSPGNFTENIPLFVYNDRKELVYSNRGTGRRRLQSSGDLEPYMADGDLLGYYFAGTLHFQNDSANARFLDNIVTGLWLALIVSFIASVLLALYFSKSLSRPARRVAEGLNQIMKGVRRLDLPETGPHEMALIAKSVNKLSYQLSLEQELRRQWAQDVAHDLRTPISALKAQFEGMRDGVLDLSMNRIERNIIEISRLEKLVTDLEELMNLESPERALTKRDISLQDMFDELRERYAFQLKKKKIHWHCISEMDCFSADESLVHRALSNLISNAVRHTGDGGSISITVEDLGKSVSIRVTDSGEGIPEEDLDRVFDRLYRGEKARHTPGSGLGLTIVKRIAELHGGAVTLTSSQSSGTTVELTLAIS